MRFKEIIIKTIDVVNGTYVDSNNITQLVQPLEIYLVPIPSTTEHERFVADNNGFVSKQSSGSAGGDFVPLTGTEFNKPLTGNIAIEVPSRDELKIGNDSVDVIFDTFSARLEAKASNYISTVQANTEFASMYSANPDGFYKMIKVNPDGVYLDGVEDVTVETVKTLSIDPASKKIYMSESSGDNFIPLTGTEEDRPLVSPIEVSGSANVGLLKKPNGADPNEYNLTVSNSLGTVIESKTTTGGIDSKLSVSPQGIKVYSEFSPNAAFIRSDMNAAESKIEEEVQQGNFATVTRLNHDGYFIQNGNSSIAANFSFTHSLGVWSDTDFSAVIDPLAYAQQKYVDESVAAIGQPIPLSGTQDGNPVTGNITFNPNISLNKTPESGEDINSKIGFVSNVGTTIETWMDNGDGSSIYCSNNAVSFVTYLSGSSKTIYFNFDSGLTSDSDFSTITNPLAFAQQSYVDQAIASAIGGGDFIPLSGTESGKQVLGDIELQTGVKIKKIINEVADDTMQNHIALEVDSVRLGSATSHNANYLIHNPFSTQVSINNLDTSDETLISFSPYGVTANKDFSGNLNPLNFAQQKFVTDTAITRLGNTKERPILNSLVFDKYYGILSYNDTTNQSSAVNLLGYGVSLQVLSDDAYKVSGITVLMNESNDNDNLTSGIVVRDWKETEGRGLRGFHDYTNNIQDLDYTQKKYVDQYINELTSLKPIDFAYGTGVIVTSEVVGNYVFLGISGSITLAVDETITITLPHTVKPILKSITGYADLVSYIPVGLVLKADNDTLLIINKNNTEVTAQFSDKMVFDWTNQWASQEG